ncbi:MAG: hypothetical protein ACREDK_06965 [Thermoplasmata archaeon]
MRGPFDEWLFSTKSRFAFIVTVLVVGTLVILLLALAGLRPIPELQPSATVTDALTALLALGTLSLAYAAGLQALSAERKREGDLRPHLDVQVIKGPGGPVVWSTFLVDESASVFHVRLRNYGPGVAVGVRLTGFDWRVSTGAESEELGDLTRGGPPRQPVVSAPGLIPSEVVKEPISLAVNEGFEVHYQTRIPPLKDLGAQQLQPSSSYLQQVLFVATCKDVEERDAGEVSAAFRLDALFPAASTEGKALRNYTSVWHRLSTSDVARIPRGRFPDR